MQKALRVSLPVLLSVLAFGASAPLAFAAPVTVTDQSTLVAALADSSVETITFENDITVTSQMTVNRSVTIDGAGHRLSASFAKTDNSNNSAIGITSSNVTVQDLIVDGSGGTNLHGINVYQSTDIILSSVTISSFRSGVVVNGSTVSATNLNTSGNTWNSVNVDPGVGVTLPSVFTLNSGTLADTTQIWSDGANVTETATVTVNAPGYTKYAHPGYGPRAFFWMNVPLTNAATITNGDTTSYYSTIQAAVTAAAPGDTVNVAPGTYAAGQIVIDEDLTITGDTSNKPVIQPTGNFTGANASDSWILVESGVAFNLNNVVLDGNTFFLNRALRSHGNTTINNVDFQKIWGSADGLGSPYMGMAIVSFGGTVPGGSGVDSHSAGGANAHLTVTNSTFANIGRIGALIKGTGSTATLTGNTYTGKGDGDFLDYAFEFGAGGSGTVDGNIISGNRGVASDGSTSAGILVTEYYGSGTTATITGNTFSNNSAGLHVGYLDTDASVVVARNNNFAGETVGLESDATTITVDASNNWWGSSLEADVRSKTLGLVNYAPWYLNEAKTELSSANEITSFGLTALSVTGVIDAAAHTVSLNVPFGTDVAALVPTIAVSTGATVSPDSGVPADFSLPKTYTVTSADGTTQDYTVTVDVAPDAPVISTTAHSVKTDTVDISGTAQADSTVTITGGTAVATGIATGGSFTITVTLNQNAVNNLSATATNAANNTSVASASVAITHDNIAPTGTIVINGGAAYTNNQIVTLTLSASDALSGVTQMEVYKNTFPQGIEPYSTTRSLTLTTGDVTKTVKVKFFDAVGNASSLFTSTIILDTTAPVVNSINLPAGVYGPGDTIAVTVSADAAGYAANATVNGKSVSLVDAGSGTYTGTYTVEEGDADVAAGATPTASVTLTDAASNSATFTTVSEVDGEVVIDTTAPTIELNGDNPQTVERTTAYVEAGATATDNYDSDISDSITTISSAVNTAVVGSYTVTYNVSDTNGNAATQATRTVTVVDTTAPAVTKLGDGTADYAIAAGASTELVFSEPIDAASQTAVENALTAGASAAPASYSWSGGTLTITASAAGLTFANDVKVTSVRDAEANASGELTLVDSAIEATQTAPDESGAVTVDSATPQVVITSPTQAVAVTVNAGTTDASLDFGSLVTSGTGTLPQVTITAASLGNAKIEIPADTVVTSAENTWDGVMSMPTVTSVALPALTGETKTLGMALEIGYPDATLTFSKGVRLLLPGQTGKRVGYTPAGGSFTEITSVCAADDQATGDALASDSECKKDIGTDMVVWTKHFSTFSTFSASIAAPVISLRHVSGGMDVSMNAAGAGLTTHYTTDGSVPTCSSTEYGNGSAFSVSSGTVVKAIRCDSLGYSSAVASSQTVASGSGSGSGGGGGGGSVAAAPAVAATPTVSPATPATPAVPAQGRVLGAEAYNFTKDMHLGSTGADVTELQKVLIAGGFDIPAITKGTVGYGYFGGQTLSAVIAYQKARGISPARGYVSTLTRAELNKGSVGASEGAPAAGKSNLTASQADSILALLESFGAEASVVAKVKATLGR